MQKKEGQARAKGFSEEDVFKQIACTLYKIYLIHMLFRDNGRVNTEQAWNECYGKYRRVDKAAFAEACNIIDMYTKSRTVDDSDEIVEKQPEKPMGRWDSLKRKIGL